MASKPEPRLTEGSAPTLSPRELNRAVLARQMLLEPARAPIPKVLDRMGTLQAQYAPSMYIGLWSRMESLQRDQLTTALERRKVVQGWLMRTTIHLSSADDWWPLLAAIRKERRKTWLRAKQHQVFDARQMAAAARKLRTALADGPMGRKKIDELLGGGSVMTNGVGLWVDLVRVPPSGTWERRRADLYGLAADWLGLPGVTHEQGLELIVRRYLGGFGPAALPELGNWAGLPPKALEPVVAKLKLRRFRDEDGFELLDLPRAPLPDPETPAPIRFLPTWDATLLAHARRAEIIREQDRPRIFNTKTPQSMATFLVDGQVEGSWRYEKGRIKVEPFGKLSASVKKALNEEADRLAAFHAE